VSRVDIETLFDAGAHFGHKTSRWHPAMEPYIHSSRSGTHIIDLNKTSELLELACNFVNQTASEGKPVLLVGTKRQAQSIVAEMAKDTQQPYVNLRWFGGQLTNIKTMQERVKRLKDLESKMASGELASRYNKLEVQRFAEEIDRLTRDFGGIKDMNGLPGAVVVFGAVHDKTAIKEANKLDIAVVAVVDSNADPRNRPKKPPNWVLIQPNQVLKLPPNQAKNNRITQNQPLPIAQNQNNYPPNNRY
jgi:small subunit ribosomal protein S2